MREDTAILEVMLELCEEENKELRDENTYLQTLVKYLEYQNKVLKQKNNDLILEYNGLVDIKMRYN